jgi:sigma-B regulation protein RsbU (phosphoserine phosphatase)
MGVDLMPLGKLYNFREIRQLAEGKTAAQDTLLKLLVGCDEILTNVIKHAYGVEKRPGPLWCGGEVSPSLIRFIIRHHGAGITQEQAAAQADARSRKQGGHGLALVHRVFSQVHFSKDHERGSEIVLEKALL